MRDMMQAKVGIIRTKAELEEALDDLKVFKERAMACSSGTSRQVQLGLASGASTSSTWLTCPTLLRSQPSLARRVEVATRDDFPTPEDDYWGKTLNVIWMEEGEMKIRQEPVEEIRDDLKDALTEVKAMIAERAAEAGGGN